MVLDFLEDLAPFTIAEIEVAIRNYRRDPKNKFFPTPAQLLAILRPPADPSDKRSRLPVFHGYPEPARSATRSVAQVLRDHGYETQAQAWEGRVGGKAAE
jgi:hypothetical protein